jgi:hypothetical protein
MLALFAGCGSSGAAPAVAAQPSSQAVVVGQTATFSVIVNGSAPFAYQWQKDGMPIKGAISASYTTPPTTTSDNGSQFGVVVGNTAGRITSKTATLSVSPATDVLTFHNDVARTGQNLTEAILTTENVKALTFGKIGFYAVDGVVDAQPLVASNVAVPSAGNHNLLIVPTENDSVYAFDADTGATIWKTSTVKTGETASDDLGCPFVSPEIGVTSTPVIDRTRGPNGAVYVVAMSKDGAGNYFQRIHALDLALGTELFGGPVDIQATYPGTGDNSNGTNVIFDPMQYVERPALLLLNGVVYTSWASHCDDRPYTGWVIGYSASTLAQTSVEDVVPNGDRGAVWMSGGGLAADSSGNIYFADANGSFDGYLDANGFPLNGDIGNALIKLSTTNNQLGVADYFEMDDGVQESGADTDFGSGGVLVLPDLKDGSGVVKHLIIGAGKDHNLYVVNRDNMGKYDPNANHIYQELDGVLTNGVWSTPAYFNSTVYYGPIGSPIKAFAITDAKLSAASTAQTAVTFGYPGATPSVSANGTNEAILWAVQNTKPAILHAYDTNLNELYNSNQASGNRDQFGDGNKFVTPTIVNGKVFVATATGIAVFGLLPAN